MPNNAPSTASSCLRRSSSALDRAGELMSGVIAVLRDLEQRHLLLSFARFLPSSKREVYRSILRCVLCISNAMPASFPNPVAFRPDEVMRAPVFAPPQPRPDCAHVLPDWRFPSSLLARTLPRRRGETPQRFRRPLMRLLPEELAAACLDSPSSQLALLCASQRLCMVPTRVQKGSCADALAPRTAFSPHLPPDPVSYLLLCIKRSIRWLLHVGMGAIELRSRSCRCNSRMTSTGAMLQNDLQAP